MGLKFIADETKAVQSFDIPKVWVNGVDLEKADSYDYLARK